MLEGAKHDGAVRDERADHVVVIGGGVELGDDVCGDDGEEEAAVLFPGCLDVLVEGLGP